MEAHGGYICLYEDVDVAWLHQMARLALEEDGQSYDDVGLMLTMLGRSRVLRLAWDAPFTYGRAGACWYLNHHALARRLSAHLGVTMHAYVFDPEEVEQVTSYGNGHCVGGEQLRYVDAELPDDEEDEYTFERLKEKWPLGHLACVLGVARDELIRLPRQATALIDLKNPHEPTPLWQVFPESVRKLRQHELFSRAS